MSTVHLDPVLSAVVILLAIRGLAAVVLDVWKSVYWGEQ